MKVMADRKKSNIGKSPNYIAIDVTGWVHTYLLEKDNRPREAYTSKGNDCHSFFTDPHGEHAGGNDNNYPKE